MGALLETIKTGLMGFDGRRRPSHANNQLPLIWENGTRENVRNDGAPSVTSDSASGSFGHLSSAHHARAGICGLARVQK